MASIDRTAYPRFKSSLTATELQALYRPTDEEQRFVTQYARGHSGQLTMRNSVSLPSMPEGIPGN